MIIIIITIILRNSNQFSDYTKLIDTLIELLVMTKHRAFRKVSMYVCVWYVAGD